MFKIIFANTFILIGLYIMLKVFFNELKLLLCNLMKKD